MPLNLFVHCNTINKYISALMNFKIILMALRPGRAIMPDDDAETRSARGFGLNIQLGKIFISNQFLFSFFFCCCFHRCISIGWAGSRNNPTFKVQNKNCFGTNSFLKANSLLLCAAGAADLECVCAREEKGDKNHLMGFLTY